MTNTSRPWVGALEHRDQQLVDSYLAMREHILKGGAIPAKYKLLMATIADAITAPTRTVSQRSPTTARAASASEAQITERVEVGYLWGGTAALVMDVDAFTSS